MNKEGECMFEVHEIPIKRHRKKNTEKHIEKIKSRSKKEEEACLQEVLDE